MDQNHSHAHRGMNDIRFAFIINLCFTIIEIAGGIWTNSVAILSDALHDLGDSVSLGLSWFLEKVSHKKRDKQFTYGYRRFSLLSAYINSMILITGSMLILYIAIPRLFNPTQPDVQGMLYLAILGILFNGLGALRLRRGKTLNQQVVSWHLLEDTMGWVAILVLSIVMRIWWLPILDPILSILITIIVLVGVLRNFKKILTIFLQAKPDNIEVKDLENRLVNLEGVHSVHDIHLWSMDGDYLVMTVHVVVADEMENAAILNLKKQIHQVSRELEINHLTIEVEYESEMCILEDC